MKHLLQGIIICLVTSVACKGIARSTNCLQTCWQKQAKGLNKKSLHIQYTLAKNMLYHSYQPWQTYLRKTTGNVWINQDVFSCIDTLQGRKGKMCSKTQYTLNCLLEQDYGDTSLATVTKSELDDQLLITAQYNPAMLLNYFYHAKPQLINSDEGLCSVYKLIINKTFTSLYINNENHLVKKLVMLNDHDMYGDVVNTIYYNDYKLVGDVYVPDYITIEKVNGKAIDTLTINNTELTKPIIPLLNKPENYSLQEEPLPKTGSTLVKYNEHVSFVQFANSSSQAILVTFKDFTAIIDAPLKSANGAELLQEVKKLAPGKPVKYFSFGHHHPWYLGGIRPMIDAGVNIISRAEDTTYINYLSNAAHTIRPDDLQHSHKPVSYDILNDSTVISDGTYEIRIYHMGKKSNHTSDYLIYYFPAEKLLFEDDLVWINDTGEIKKAGEGQAGLYHLIKDLHLDVQNIVQGWPLSGYNVKTTIPFVELERSITAQ